MMQRDQTFRLRDGSPIAVIGAGPSGSIFACQLLRLAGERGLELDVRIFDRKLFLRHGPPGCNLCAGIVCSGLLRDLAGIGLELPFDRTQRVIEGYRFLTPAGEIRMSRAATHGPIVTVYRGNGPVSGTPHADISFDDFLLKHALRLGAQLIPATVEAVDPPRARAQRASVTYRTDSGTERLEADLVAIACGVNSTLAASLERAGFGYRRPHARRCCQAEISLDNDFIDARFGNDIHVFALGLKRIRFGALVPKRDFITLSLIGHGDIGPDDLDDFVNRREVRAKLPPGWRFAGGVCHCYPLMPVTPARMPHVDRLVVIGDAAVSRYCKNGIGSAYTTATLAAHAVMDYGVSAEGLRRHYELHTKRLIARDNLYGRALAASADVVTRSRYLSSIYCGVRPQGPRVGAPGAFHTANWIMITGDRPYREAARAAASPGFALGVLGSAARHVARSLGLAAQPPTAARHGCAGQVRPRLGPLHDGQTVAIVGGGPAGASCAIALKRLAAQRAIQLNVLLYESKAFETKEQYNQCAGLLSPPIVELLERDLGVRFPHELVQRQISDYLFHGEAQSIRLSGDAGPSMALRRVEFDRYLFREAVRCGVRTVSARVTDIELDRRGVRVFSESGSEAADIVVGAFGLDEGTASVFRRAVGYRPPAWIETLVTKLHPSPEQMARHGETVYAFLPPMPRVEFAAVIPKGNHLTIVLAGAHLRAGAMDRLLAWPPVRQIVCQEDCREQQLQCFKGRFATSQARNICGERWVTVGDASGLVRPFKGKGVTAACLTGHLAARMMVEVGISERAASWFRATCRDLAEDIFFGRIVRRMVGLVRRTGTVDELIAQAHKDAGLRAAMYCCVSGQGAFRKMLAETLAWRRVVRVSSALLRNLLRRR